jgi:hypothetical protein
MPANLSPAYLEAEARYKQARTPPEKLAALEEMLATIPKHKGTEKMQADLKRRLAKLRGDKQKPGGPSRAAPVYQIEREGAGQIALVGPPNSGKSSLLARLTHAAPVVADYPFSTRVPCPGMMPFENIQIQLVDLPPLHPDFPESWLPQVIRNADAVALVVDLADPAVLERLTQTLALLEEAKIFAGDDARELSRGAVRKRALLVVNKMESGGRERDFNALNELWKDRFPIVGVSAQTGEGLEALRRALFELLEVVRVFSKPPGKKPDLAAPFVLPRGATILDLAERVHKDLRAQLKFARVWNGRYDGQRVERHHALEDADVVELHL